MATYTGKLGEMMPLYAPNRDDPDTVPTIRGRIPWSEYLDMEKRRIERNPNRRVEIRGNQLWVDCIANMAGYICQRCGAKNIQHQGLAQQCRCEDNREGRYEHY
jgi:hypothetical protein